VNFKQILRAQRASKFDLAVAAFAALSAGFVFFAMPEWRLTQIVLTSGLPSIIGAAQPPLGGTARIAAMVAASGIAFAIAFLVMANVDRFARRKPASVEAPVVQPIPLRVRRADGHPDAPPRRPILAREDFGEPAEFTEIAADEPVAEQPAPEPLPPFLAPEQPPERVETAAETAPEPEPLELTQFDAIQPQSFPPAPPIVQQQDEEAEGETLSKLMRRLEKGLGRREQALPQQAEEPAAAPSPVGQEPVRHRLRSAINDLQKVASRAG
jgi:hypothetical protein